MNTLIIVYLSWYEGAKKPPLSVKSVEKPRIWVLIVTFQYSLYIKTKLCTICVFWKKVVNVALFAGFVETLKQLKAVDAILAIFESPFRGDEQ
jgi:hypothetical protein